MKQTPKAFISKEVEAYKRQQNVRVEAKNELRYKERIQGKLEGSLGAQQYLAAYGTGISSEKLCQLARIAERSGDLPMANAFWTQAYRIETKKNPMKPGINPKADGNMPVDLVDF